MDTHCRKCNAKTADQDKKFTRKGRRIWLSALCGVCLKRKGRWCKREAIPPLPTPKNSPEPELDATTDTEQITQLEAVPFEYDCFEPREQMELN